MAAQNRLRWIGPGQSITVGGVQLSSPLVYAGDSAHEPSAINPALPIASCQQPIEWIDASPRYDRLNRMQRFSYVSWLATGVNAAPADPGFRLLYLYGLERRALHENADPHSIFDRLVRLLKTTPGEHADAPARRSARLALWLVLRNPIAFDARRVQALFDARPNWTDDDVAASLSWFQITGLPLQAWAIFDVAQTLPESQRSVVVKRLADEFQTLLRKRFQEKFPNGLVLPAGAANHEWSYRPANPTLAPPRVPIANPIADPKVLEPLSHVWNNCIAELRKLSTVVARHGQTLSVEAWQAMPPEMRGDTEHPALAPVSALLKPSRESPNRQIVSALNLAKAMQIQIAGKITISQSKRLGEIANEIGYALEPDARVTGKAFSEADELALFPLHGQDLPDRRRYVAATCILRIGFAVAAVDGVVAERETRAILQQLESAFTDAVPRDRLDAAASLLARLRPGELITGSPVEKLTAAHRKSVGRLVSVVIAADREMTPEKHRAIAHVCSQLGFNTGEVESILKDFPPGSPALKLDRESIRSIMQETHEVAEMLASAMAGEQLKPVHGEGNAE